METEILEWQLICHLRHHATCQVHCLRGSGTVAEFTTGWHFPWSLRYWNEIWHGDLQCTQTPVFYGRRFSLFLDLLPAETKELDLCLLKQHSSLFSRLVKAKGHNCYPAAWCPAVLHHTEVKARGLTGKACSAARLMTSWKGYRS